MGVFAVLILALVAYRVYKFYDQTKVLDRFFSMFNYGDQTQVESFLSNYIKNDLIYGKIIDGDEYTLIVSMGDIPMCLQIYWEEDIIEIDMNMRLFGLNIGSYKNKFEDFNTREFRLVLDRILLSIDGDMFV